MSQSYGVPRWRFLHGLGEWHHGQRICDAALHHLTTSGAPTWTAQCGQHGYHQAHRGKLIRWDLVLLPQSRDESVYFRVSLANPSEVCDGGRHSSFVALLPLTSQCFCDLGPVLVESGPTSFACRRAGSASPTRPGMLPPFTCPLSSAYFATETTLSCSNFTFASFGVTNVPTHSSGQAFSLKRTSLSFAANCSAGSIICIQRAKSTATSKLPTSSSPPQARSSSPISASLPSCPRRPATLLSAHRSGWHLRSSARQGMASRRICGPSVSPL